MITSYYDIENTPLKLEVLYELEKRHRQRHIQLQYQFFFGLLVFFLLLAMYSTIVFALIGFVLVPWCHFIIPAIPNNENVCWFVLFVFVAFNIYFIYKWLHISFQEGLASAERIHAQQIADHRYYRVKELMDEDALHVIGIVSSFSEKHLMVGSMVWASEEYLSLILCVACVYKFMGKRLFIGSGQFNELCLTATNASGEGGGSSEHNHPLLLLDFLQKENLLAIDDNVPGLPSSKDKGGLKDVDINKIQTPAAILCVDIELRMRMRQCLNASGRDVLEIIDVDELVILVERSIAEYHYSDQQRVYIREIPTRCRTSADLAEVMLRIENRFERRLAQNGVRK